MVVSSVVPLSKVYRNQRLEAEFYKPNVVQYLNNNLDWKRIGSILDFVQYGTSRALNEDGIGYKVFRLNEIQNCFLTKPEKWVSLSNDQYESFRLEKNDVLFCRTNGNIKYVGRTGILKEDVDSVFASYLVRVRPNYQLILPEYLTIYLSSNVGRAFVERQAMHSNQFNVSAEQLKKIPIPVFDLDFQEEILELVEEAASLKQSSNNLGAEAKTILLEELGLLEYSLKYEHTFSENSSMSLFRSRLDAEHFQPANAELVHLITDYQNGYAPLLSYVDYIEPKFNPKIFPDRIFAYIELSDIDASIGIIHSCSELLGEGAPNRAKRILKTNDVIASSVEGSFDKVALIAEEQSGNIASNGFFQFRVLKMRPEVLLVMCQTLVIQAQFERESTGSILMAVPKSGLRRIVIPTIPDDVQLKIASLVQESHEARRESNALLNQAKANVEAAIEFQE